MRRKVADWCIEQPKVGVIGYGSIASKHIGILSKLCPSAKFHVLSARQLSPSKSENTLTFHTEIDSFLAVDLNMVVIASAASRHVTFFEKILDKGLPILVEKPIASSESDARKMEAVARMATFSPVVGYNIRFSEAFKSVANVIQKEMLGNVFCVQAVVGQNLETWRPGRDLKSTVSASRQEGGGVLRELSHEIDYLSSLFGEIIHVNGSLSKRKFKNFDVEDTALLLLSCNFKNDALPISLNMDFTRHDCSRYCYVIAERGTLHWDAINGNVSIKRPAGEIEQIYDNANDLELSSINMWNAFLMGDMTSFSGLSSARKIIEQIERIERASVDFS